MAYTALQVADEIIQLANEEEENVSQLKLIKICYFIKAWGLAIRGNTIFKESVEAWRHGPVVPEVYHEFKVFGSSGISYRPPEKSSIEESHKAFIKSVWDVYKGYGAFTLREITHEKGSPWHQCYDGTPHKKIPNKIIKDFYSKKLKN